MQMVFDYIETHWKDALGDLIRLCRQPSVSAQGIGVEEMAQLTAEMLRECGISTQILPVPGNGYPVVYGEIPGDSPATIMFYNHYDVQPPEPLDGWSSPPFEPTIADGCIRARGVADNKGNIVARLAAIKALQAVRGSLPASVKFFIEGEEEIESPNLPAFVDDHRELLRADACLWEGGAVNWEGQLHLILGIKGILSVELEAKAASRDLHSSMATVVPSAAWRLVWALNTLKDKDENILIEGFYDEVRAPIPREIDAVKAMPSEEEELGRSLGVGRFLRDLSGFDFRVRHLLEPTCNIQGIITGYTGEGTKTVLPCLAQTKLDFRLVPHQTPQDVLKKLRRHLDRHGFKDVVIASSTGEHPARTPIDSPFVQIVADAARGVYGVEPVISPTWAATGPMFPFIDALGLPTVSCGVEYPESREHAPDENIRLDDFVKGIKLVAALMERFGASYSIGEGR